MRANWHLAAAGPVDTGDPFAELDRAEQADRPDRLRTLVLQEADLDHVGITCHLKERDWAHPSCSVCPERGTADRAPLCRVGLAQEELCR